MAHKFLVHEPEDMVGVAVADIRAGEVVEGLVMTDRRPVVVRARDDIPLGHKLALRDIRRGETVLKYNHPIGEATRDIQQGEHVHTHNLRSIRWRASVLEEAAASV
jgi:(2R)-sulfolactate sulfo-lyase subunit alpha